MGGKARGYIGVYVSSLIAIGEQTPLFLVEKEAQYYDANSKVAFWSPDRKQSSLAEGLGLRAEGCHRPKAPPVRKT